MTDSIEIPTIADNCVQAVLSRKRLATTRKVDDGTRDAVRQQLGDESLSLQKHLFKRGPVREVLRLLDRAYEEHKNMTAPWVDRGPRILPAAKFEEYAERMEGHKVAIEQALANVVANWDDLVQRDMDERSAKATTSTQRSLIRRDEYPSAHEAAYMFSMTWKVRPIAKSDDFRTDVPQYAKDRLQDELQEAVEVVRRDLIKRMLKPVQDAVEKLKIPIGEKGGIFRDSLIQNMRSALNTARDLNVGDDPELEEVIKEMNLVVNGYVGTPETMRNMQQRRDVAVKKLDDLANTLSGL